MVMHAVQALYTDLLTRHRERKDELVAEEPTSGTRDREDMKKAEDTIRKTAKALAMYGNQQNKNVVALIAQQLAAHCLEVEPFDEDRHLFRLSRRHTSRGRQYVDES